MNHEQEINLTCVRSGLSGALVRPLYTWDEIDNYCTMALICHDFVDSYRDAHPDCDLLYYDALELASPEWSAKVKAWSADYQKRRAAYKQWSDNLKPLTFPE